jgi:glyoxylase-like metal-dependent hydrolase (beta-lactamase superfamily II)
MGKKTAKKIAARNRPAAKGTKRKGKRPEPSGAEAVPAVRVRMFRQGLGDCFLVTFDVGGDERHMLIDCGTLGKKNTSVTFPDIAQHIEQTIGRNGRLHVVVATHEHQDHLSGFRNDAIRKLAGRVDHVWLAWTENPQDEDAKKLAKYKKDLVTTLAAIAAAAPQSPVGLHVHDLLGFAGDMAEGPLEFARTVNEAMEFVRTGLGLRPSISIRGT